MRGHLPVAMELAVLAAASLAAAACLRSAPRAAPAAPVASGPVAVVAVESVLADFTRQVAGDRAAVQALVPAGVDPRGYQPTPDDIAAAARARLVIANGAGMERFMGVLLSRSGPGAPVLEASHGLEKRTAADGAPEPHLWLDPVMAVRYVQNIRDALSRADPAGEIVYGANGDAYIRQLRDLDAWIQDQVGAIPAEKRVLATTGAELAYFGDRYGIQIAAQPDAPPGPAVLTGLTGPSGPAPTYLELMRYDVKLITAAMGSAP